MWRYRSRVDGVSEWGVGGGKEINMMVPFYLHIQQHDKIKIANYLSASIALGFMVIQKNKCSFMRGCKMSIDKLFSWRFILPVVFVALLFLPLLQPNIDLQSFLKISVSNDSILYFVLVIVVGGVYYILNPRYYAMRPSILKIQENIKDKLLLPFEKDATIKKKMSSLREGSILLDIFYSFVDNDKSLTERAKEVYFNGLMLSSIADIRVLSFIAGIVYFIWYAIMANIVHLVFSVGCFGLFGLTYLLMPIATRRHINLSNKQLEYITTRLLKELRDSLKAVKK
jgi:hypothetical protein